MQRICGVVLCVLVACKPSSDADSDEAALLDPLPAFVDDCEEQLNDSLETVSGIEATDGFTVSANLCHRDVDMYRVDVPAHSWLSFQIDINGSGDGSSDLDLWQVEDPANPVDPYLDMVDDDDEDRNAIWLSATEQPYERLAWYNNTDAPVSYYVAVDGYVTANADYSVLIRVDGFEEGLDCDEFYDDPSDAGPCNRIMQFPQADTIEEGYVVSHWAHYSNLRRELIYLVRHAAAETALAFEDTNPIGLLDMGQTDGDVPGRMEGRLRHPEGTHVNGNDLDVAYYQTGEDNLGRSVCPEDGYFCTAKPDILDAERSAFFIMKLMESPHVRVIGVDTMIAPELKAAASDLEDRGMVLRSDVSKLNSYLAYGDGWPFHQHHLHFSWDWEEHNQGKTAHPTGCGHNALAQPTKVRTGIGQ